MGVPAFFRWLSRKYPSVIVHCVEDKTIEVNGVRVPLDSSEPNPNGIEFDNLYLDMNGIIHPCTHPEDRPAPRNENEMMIAIFDCIDRLFRIVRPRKLLYMAIDGVAPRAKMNQQRSRRFRASKETYEKINEIDRIRTELTLKGAELPPEKAKGEHFDSNCITPGTPFMSKLSACLDYYVHDRLNNDPGWKGVKVILSDANVPGEGEHKIMDYIRKQRAQPDHDPNTQHCLCGADADLIMLGLATHEPNFTIIREEFKPNKPRPCEICGQLGHDMKDCLGLENKPSNVDGVPGAEMETICNEVEFIFVRLNVLREYLERDLAMPNLPFKYDFERVIDDWVFMCFFVGNDFLPHLPSLEIREGAIDRLISLYKDAVYKTGGYLTDSGDVNLERVQLIMLQLGKQEDEIFKRRQQNELMYKAREKAKRRRTSEFNQYRPNWSLIKNTQFEPKAINQASKVVNPRQEAFTIRKAGMHTTSSSSSSVDYKLEAIKDNKGALQKLIEPISSTSSSSKEGDRGGGGGGGGGGSGTKRKRDDNEEEEEDEEPNDEVRLWEDGFKDRYYESKFDVKSDNLEFRYSVALQYIRGLCWVLKYYYQGCASWKWYFPYHYAPFASDFVNIAGLSTEFESDTVPFKPLEQLMGVFPAASCKHVPEPWRKLMSDIDSPIIDFYPEDFKIDLNGKKFAWQGVALLPFVEEERLFNALIPYYDALATDEVKRNVRGDDKLYVTTRNDGFEQLNELYKQNVDDDIESSILIDGMKGTVLTIDEFVGIGGYLESPVIGLDTITDNMVVCVRYRDPKYTRGYVFPAMKLKGAKSPGRVLKPEDLEGSHFKNWRPQIGMAPSTTRATLTTGGHRMLNHYNRRNQDHHNQHRNNNAYNNSDGIGQTKNYNTYDYNRRGGNGSGGRGGGTGGYQHHQQQKNYHSYSSYRGGGNSNNNNNNNDGNDNRSDDYNNGGRYAPYRQRQSNNANRSGPDGGGSGGGGPYRDSYKQYRQNYNSGGGGGSSSGNRR